MPQDILPLNGPGTEPHEVRCHFRQSTNLQAAVDKLSLAGFDRADLSLPNDTSSSVTPDTAARPANTEEDARQLRTVQTSTGAAIAAMAAAGVTLATGGAAAPAVAAALIASGVVGGGIFAVTSAVNADEQGTRDTDAAAGTLILSVRAATPARQQEAEAILLAAGGTDVVRS